jgi:hypothetical protein
MTFDAALERFWLEVGDHYRGTYKQTVFTALQWLLEDRQCGSQHPLAGHRPE